jgi:hypothetical protein
MGITLLWVLFFFLLGWAFYKIFFSTGFVWSKRSKKLTGEIIDIEPGLFDANWEEELQKALKENNVRLVIRYSYMRLLQIMQERGAIQFRADKTNYEYYHELKDPYKQPFKVMTRQYEYVWYGDLPISQAMYEEYMNNYNQLKRIVNG